MDSNFTQIFDSLKEESDENILWKIDLDCFILKVIPIESTSLTWVIPSENHVFLVDTENGNILQKFDNIADIIFSAVIHPSSNDLFIASSNGVFSLSTAGKINHLIDEKNWFEHIAISADGNVVFSAKGKTLYILEKNNTNYELVKKDSSFNSTISDVIFNIDSFLVSNYGSVREYKTENFNKFQLLGWKTSLLKTSWSPDKKLIAAGTQENSIHFWPYPFEQDEDFQINGYQSKVSKMIWACNSTEFVVNCHEDVHIWDFYDGPPKGKSPITLVCGYGKIVDIAYTGNILIAASDKGFIFYFEPYDSTKYIQIHSVADKISCIQMNENEDKLFVGTNSGTFYCFKIS